MLDHLGQHSHLGVVVFVCRRGRFDLCDELLCSLMLHDSLVMEVFVLSRLKEGRIEKFFFYAGVDL